MRASLIGLVAGGSLLAAGCASMGDGRRAGSELVGRSVHLETARGQDSTLYFNADGSVRSVFGKREASGRWSVSKKRLCFTWAGDFRECWPYAAPLQPGQTRAIRSDRGNDVKVTLR